MQVGSRAPGFAPAPPRPHEPHAGSQRTLRTPRRPPAHRAPLQSWRPEHFGMRHSACESPRGPRRPHTVRPGTPSPQVSEPLAEPRALSRGVYGPLKPKSRRLAPGRVSEKGALTSCCPNHLGIPKFKCLPQQRIRTSVFRYLLPFLPVSKFPLRAVPLVKTGHPLRLPPNK